MKDETERGRSILIIGRPAQFRRICHPGLIKAYVDASREGCDGLDVGAFRINRAHMEVAHQIEREAGRHLAGEYTGHVDLGIASRTLPDDVENPDHGAQRSRLDAALQVGLFPRQDLVAHVLEINLVAQLDKPDDAIIHN